MLAVSHSPAITGVSDATTVEGSTYSMPEAGVDVVVVIRLFEEVLLCVLLCLASFV